MPVCGKLRSNPKIIKSLCTQQETHPWCRVVAVQSGMQAPEEMCRRTGGQTSRKMSCVHHRWGSEAALLARAKEQNHRRWQGRGRLGPRQKSGNESVGADGTVSVEVEKPTEWPRGLSIKPQGGTVWWQGPSWGIRLLQWLNQGLRVCPGTSWKALSRGWTKYVQSNT